MTITLPAYAKINLFLDIVSRREDKYHNIISYMQSVSLHDTITVSFDADDAKSVEIICNNTSVPNGTDNLIYKAAQAFPAIGKIKVILDKKIPMSAGLAGGSTDAATTLKALNHLTGSILSKEDLKKIGAKLGADIPFCIDGGAALAEGIGDILQKAEPMPHFPIVIAKIGEGMSTPAAYGQLDKKYDSFNGYKPQTDKLNLLFDRSIRSDAGKYCEGLFNVFESVVEPQRPFVTEIKSIMTNCGAEGAVMSGSGTSVFGIFSDEANASDAIDRLNQAEAQAYLCYPVK